jgi:hypothetical protein
VPKRCPHADSAIDTAFLGAQIYDAGSHEWLGAVEVELPAPPVPPTMVSLDELLRRVQVSGLEPLPPPVGKLAKSSNQYGHQLFCIT